MPVDIIQVDAFTDRAFEGNPAAVVITDSPQDEGWMQLVAMEMNLSETAFLYPQGDGYRLRWFTPAVEVDLCGHATLASAFVLFTDGHVPADRPVTFQSNSGPLHASFADDRVTLDFPAIATTQAGPNAELVNAMGKVPVQHVRSKFDDLFEYESPDDVRNLKPDFGVLKRLSRRGVIVTARGDGEFDFTSRFFAPAVGIDEDPVTGSAHCVLATYWQARLGKSEFIAYQASRRGGVLWVTLRGDRVEIGGRAVITLRGTLLV